MHAVVYICLSDSCYHCATKYHELSNIEQEISYLTVLWIKEFMHRLASIFALGVPSQNCRKYWLDL